MTGNKGDAIRELITPTEAVKIALDNMTIESVFRARAIQTEWKAQDGGADDYFSNLCMIGAIYEAGRIQGKREERRKKKAYTM